MNVFKKILILFTLITITCVSASADTVKRSRYNPHFSNNKMGTVTFRWVAPVPSTVKITRYAGGYSGKKAYQTVYEGPPPSQLTLQGGGTKGGGRYTIEASTPFQVMTSGPYVVNW